MIRGMHALFYSTDAEATREFIRDKLGLPFHDAGDGWLIFDVSEADVGCHSSDRPYHAISFYCDDVKATVKEMEALGVEFTEPLREEEWGFVTSFELPGGGPVQLYEPKYQKG